MKKTDKESRQVLKQIIEGKLAGKEALKCLQGKSIIPATDFLIQRSEGLYENLEGLLMNEDEISKYQQLSGQHVTVILPGYLLEPHLKEFRF